MTEQIIIAKGVTGAVRRVYADHGTDVFSALVTAHRTGEWIDVDGRRAKVVDRETVCVALDGESQRRQREAFYIAIEVE